PPFIRSRRRKNGSPGSSPGDDNVLTRFLRASVAPWFSGPRSPFLPEERRQQRARGALPDAAIDLRAVMAGGLREHPRAVLDAAALGVVGAEIEPPHPGQGDRRGAHGAGLQGDVEVEPL